MLSKNEKSFQKIKIFQKIKKRFKNFFFQKIKNVYKKLKMFTKNKKCFHKVTNVSKNWKMFPKNKKCF